MQVSALRGCLGQRRSLAGLTCMRAFQASSGVFAAQFSRKQRAVRPFYPLRFPTENSSSSGHHGEQQVVSRCFYSGNNKNIEQSACSKTTKRPISSACVATRGMTAPQRQTFTYSHLARLRASSRPTAARCARSRIHPRQSWHQHTSLKSR